MRTQMSTASSAAKKTVSVSRRIRVSAQTAWEVVRTGDGLDRWLPGVTSCKLDGAGAGAKRTCIMNEHELSETIESVDDVSRLFQYRIGAQDLMPLRDIHCLLHVSDGGPGEANVLWLATFELLDEAAWSAVKQGLEALYVAGIDGLARHAGA
jgi:uncharacterized protein YndB with AHSA1/START domain